MIILDICVCIIVFLLGYNLVNFFSDLTKKEKSFLRKLFFFHFFIGICFSILVGRYGGDAQLYWSFPKMYELNDVFNVIEKGSPSGIVYLINYFPSHILDLSFFTGNMIYSLFGYVSFIYIFFILKRIIPDTEKLKEIKLFNIPIHPWIWFLPNLHYWSSGIGKDTILFFCIALFVYSLLEFKKRFLGIFLSIFIAILIRPHIMLFLVAAFGAAYLFDGYLKNYQKIFIFLLFIAAFASMFNYVVEFIRLESLDITTIEQYANTKASKLNQADSGSGIDISGYPFPLKVFTFLYRPLFFDINGVLAVVASFENLILLLLTIKIFRNRPYRSLKNSNGLVKGLVIYFLIGASLFSLILGNLGIMLRQKNAFIPYLIIFGLWIIFYNTQYLKSMSNNQVNAS
tara:strand:+ start:79763 stop:80962 length:1200 start_codon:yes stop_codon:yes gene_type:complete